ncbi:hypothetical protein KBA41_17365, partial [Candidatus Ozemobacteraceae bacterium]|nr:hypothetical protein [Candidatus Ozemobacteraceae bacterium]
MISTTIFGAEVSDASLSVDGISGLLATARERAVAAASVPVHEIIEVLDRVAGVWADPEHPL